MLIKNAYGENILHLRQTDNLKVWKLYNYINDRENIFFMLKEKLEKKHGSDETKKMLEDPDIYG